MPEFFTKSNSGAGWSLLLQEKIKTDRKVNPIDTGVCGIGYKDEG